MSQTGQADGNANRTARATRAVVGTRWPTILVMLAIGCGQNSFTVAPQAAAAAPPPNQDLANRNQELANRARALDLDNQELESLLAQSRQQIQLLKDELDAMRGQLHAVNQQLAEIRSEKAGLEQRTEALVASARHRPAVQIKPNNSLLMPLAIKHMPGIEVRQDGDVIRVELKADSLFLTGAATLTAEGQKLLGTITADLLRNYPHQILGVEGHGDSDAVRTPQYPSSRHLSLARATAVYEYLNGSLRVPDAQLFVVGHAANHPVVSNATSAGKARNRRIELVVYPETFRSP